MMEASSPLAAMHPAAPPTWGQGHDIYRSLPHTNFPNGNPFASGALIIKEHLHRAKPDYFNLKSVRGSSPTASLAADLSQNFRIDAEASPRFPTPRRALFTSNMMGSMENRAAVTTPPLPASSSPVALSGADMMDISPLPHKTVHIVATSPTPGELTEDDTMMVESPLAAQRPNSMTMLDPPKPLVPECRKRLALRRPSLTRAKIHSTGSVGRAHAESQLSSFKLGAEDGSPSSLTLGECFQESPPRERRPQSANSPSPCGSGSVRPKWPPKMQFMSLGGARDRHAASISHSRRSTNHPFIRRPRQYRRSLSMFEDPGEVVKPKETEHVQNSLHSVMDVEDVQEPALPHFFPDGDGDSIPRISRETFLDVMDGKYSHEYSQRLVIDCRFEYEYEGGHIDGAINYNDKELLARHLFEHPMDGKVLLIFHCEYSAHRAPMMARHIRSEDRTANAEFYPHLTYPDVYILEGGYSEFYDQHRSRCYPQSYVEMNDKDHAATCERMMDKIQQKRKALSRARTFAFGDRETMVDASPTGPGRSIPESPVDMIGNSPILGADRSLNRRMASY